MMAFIVGLSVGWWRYLRDEECVARQLVYEELPRRWSETEGNSWRRVLNIAVQVDEVVGSERPRLSAGRKDADGPR